MVPPNDHMARESRLFRSGADGDYLSRWKRIIYIDQQIRAAAYPSRKGLARACRVSDKTIQRDIVAMRDELAAPIDYDATRNGYFYTDSSYAIPAAVLGERDLFALMVAENAVAQYEGTPLYGHLREAFDRILKVLPGEVRAAHDLAARAVRFGGPRATPVDPEVWACLVTAVRDRSVVEVVEEANDGVETPARILRPLRLLVRDRKWFLVARHLAGGEELQLSLSQVLSARIVDDNSASGEAAAGGQPAA